MLPCDCFKNAARQVRSKATPPQHSAQSHDPCHDERVVPHQNDDITPQFITVGPAGQLLFCSILRLPDPAVAAPSAPAVTDPVQAPEVQQPGTRPPRCSSRPPFSALPKGRTGLREDSTCADAVAAGPVRAAPCRSAGSCRDEHLPIASADIARERGRAKPGPLTLSRHRRVTRAPIDLES